ncbi:MAG: hypothetical protein U5O39_11695 [Gammaproteobacteria bacterium]|nr:hypothetical protein [Gammaproteobacteria bacterium]
MPPRLIRHRKPEANPGPPSGSGSSRPSGSRAPGTDVATKALSSLPSVDRLLGSDPGIALIERFGRPTVKGAFRRILDDARTARDQSIPDEATICALAGDLLAAESAPSLRPVYNLTGTVLHTNLGRAPLPPEAIDRRCRRLPPNPATSSTTSTQANAGTAMPISKACCVK